MCESTHLTGLGSGEEQSANEMTNQILQTVAIWTQHSLTL